MELLKGTMQILVKSMGAFQLNFVDFDVSDLLTK